MSAPVFRFRYERAVHLEPGDLLEVNDGLWRRVIRTEPGATMLDPSGFTVTTEGLILSMSQDKRVRFLRPDEPPS